MKLSKEERARKTYFGGRTLYKWYEVNMKEPEDEASSSEDQFPTDSSEYESGEYSDEEIDLDQTDLCDDDKDLVMSIMAKFKDAHQDSVDSLFVDNNSAQSEEDLIASICAPKQNNVDSFVNQARNE